MRAVIQRVSSAQVRVEEGVVGEIGKGLVVLLGIAKGDSLSQARYISHKILHLRIFADCENKMNRSIRDIEGEILLVSQFTVLANTRKGQRPNFSSAAPRERALELFLRVKEIMENQVPVKTGAFGAMMAVELTNDGPVTIIVDSA